MQHLPDQDVSAVDAYFNQHSLPPRPALPENEDVDEDESENKRSLNTRVGRVGGNTYHQLTNTNTGSGINTSTINNNSSDIAISSSSSFPSVARPNEQQHERYRLLTQVHESLQWVHPADQSQPRAISLLQFAAEEYASEGRSEPASVCLQFAKQLLTSQRQQYQQVYDGFSQQCEKWEGVSQEKWAQLLEGCKHISELEQLNPAAADADV